MFQKMLWEVPSSHKCSMSIGLLMVLQIFEIDSQGIFKDNSIATYYNFAKHRQKCKEKPLEFQEEKAKFIFTGTVRDIEVDPGRPGHNSAQVEIKRILKGSGILDHLPVLYAKGKYASVNYRVCTVAGLGNPDICTSQARLHDTWIFFTNLANGRLELNSSLVRLSLDNIAQTEAAIKGMNHYCNLICSTFIYVNDFFLTQ